MYVKGSITQGLTRSLVKAATSGGERIGFVRLTVEDPIASDAVHKAGPFNRGQVLGRMATTFGIKDGVAHHVELRIIDELPDDSRIREALSLIITAAAGSDPFAEIAQQKEGAVRGEIVLSEDSSRDGLLTFDFGGDSYKSHDKVVQSRLETILRFVGLQPEEVFDGRRLTFEEFTEDRLPLFVKNLPDLENI